MVRHYNGPIDTLLDAHASGKPLWALCRNCGHTKLIKPWSLMRKLHGADTQRLAEVGKRFACTKCRHHVTILIPAEGMAHAYRHER
jgi:hypothetical protein